jgi:thiamine-monophosphate kinase
VNPERSPLVRELGEQGLLQRLQQFCPLEVVGDDAALLTVSPDHSLVVTEDLLVEGVHFSLGLSGTKPTMLPEDAGWRAAAANLSDLAAMGADPLGITVGLGVPGDTPVDWLESMYRGMTACLEQQHTAIVGGDICRSPILTVAIAAFGQVRPNQAIRRSTARPGDAILVTGGHGASRAGLELLLHPESGELLSQAERTMLISAHQRPQPRFDAIALLHSLTPPAPPAGMDSSDGLADAVLQVCRASSVGAVLYRDQIPIPPALRTWCPEQAMNWALYGGEDFELVLCLPIEYAVLLGDRLSESRIVGEVTAGAGVVLRDRSGAQADEVLSLDQGFQHF